MTEATTTQSDANVVAISTCLRKGDLHGAAHRLADIFAADQSTPEIATLRNRLLRLCANELSDRLSPDRLVNLTEVLLFLSPDEAVSPQLADAIAKGLSKYNTQVDGSQSTQFRPEFLAALVSIATHRRLENKLLSATLELLEADAPLPLRAELLVMILSKWREIAFEGLPSEPLELMREIGNIIDSARKNEI